MSSALDSACFEHTSSFHGTAPRTREVRRQACNKELLEKGRLKARPGHGHVQAEPVNPILPDPASALFQANAFQRDTAGHIKQQKQEKLGKQQMKYDRKRQEAAVRESLRWEQMQGVQEAEAARVQFNRDAGLKAASNKSSEHFNIISLEYHPTREGQQLRYKDEVTRYRAMLRSQNLFNKSHSTEHNIITGQPRANMVTLPPAPTYYQQ